MNISDLEIGFYVQPVNAIAGFDGCINGFHDDLITFTNWSALPPHGIVGIPISEEWMKVLAYSPSEETEEAKSFRYNDTEIVFKGQDVFWKDAEENLTKVKSVHEVKRLIYDRFGYAKVVRLQDGYPINFTTISNQGFAVGMKIRVITPTSTYIISILEEHNQGNGKTMYIIR